MVVVSPERAEDNLLKGAMPCPRCQGVLRPFGTGRTRTVRGVGADTVTVTPRRARCADCSSDPDPAADRAGGAAGRQHRSDRKRLGRQRPRRRVPNHRRPVRAARVDGPPMVASRPGAARAVNVPAGRGPGRADRPGDAGPAGAAADNPRARVKWKCPDRPATVQTSQFAGAFAAGAQHLGRRGFMQQILDISVAATAAEY